MIRFTSLIRKPLIVAAVLGQMLMASHAQADPCEAPLPKRGEVFGGLVRYVGDGDSLCVGSSSNPQTWIEVRLANFYAPELHAPGGAAAKQVLERITRGRVVQCSAQHRSYDRIVAQCSLDGSDVGSLMRSAGLQEGGNGKDAAPRRR